MESFKSIDEYNSVITDGLNTRLIFLLVGDKEVMLKALAVLGCGTSSLAGSFEDTILLALA